MISRKSYSVQNVSQFETPLMWCKDKIHCYNQGISLFRLPNIINVLLLISALMNQQRHVLVSCPVSTPFSISNDK